MINDGINEDIGHCSTLRSCILFGSQRGRGLPAHSRPQSTLKGRSWWQAPQQGRPNISDRGDPIHGEDTQRKYLTCYSGSTMMLGFPFSDVECSSTSGCHTDPPDKKLSKLLVKQDGWPPLQHHPALQGLRQCPLARRQALYWERGPPSKYFILRILLLSLSLCLYASLSLCLSVSPSLCLCICLCLALKTWWLLLPGGWRAGHGLLRDDWRCKWFCVNAQSKLQSCNLTLWEAKRQSSLGRQNKIGRPSLSPGLNTEEYHRSQQGTQKSHLDEKLDKS